MRSCAPRVLTALAGLSLAASAIAVPPIVDRCPKDAMVVVAVPNYAALKQDVTNMGNLIGMPLPDLDQALMMIGIDKGIRSDGSMALVIMPPAKDAGKDDEEAPPPFVALVPVTDYAALLGNFGVTPAGKGLIDTFQFKGSDVFAKDLGDGYAAVGPFRPAVESFTGAGGNKATFEAIAGPVGNALADKSDLSVIVNIAAARPTIEKGLKDRMEEVADRIAMQGGDDANVAVADWVVKSMLTDARGAVFTVNIENLGAAFDHVVAFTEGSRWARVASVSGKAHELMGKLPAGPFLLAGAIDYSSPEVKAWLKDLAAQMPADKADGLQLGIFDWIKQVDKNNGAALMMGPLPAGIGGGLFVNTVTFTATTDPDAAIAAAKAKFKSMEEQGLGTVKWAEGVKEIAGLQVDSFEVRMNPNPQMDPIMGMLFGHARGPNGYVAKVDGGVITTLSKNSELLQAAINAAKGENPLAQDKVMAQVGELLPKGRALEAYLGVKSILDTLLPMAAMMGIPAPTVDIPSNLPPIAFAITPSHGAIRSTVYFPAPTIRTLAELGREFKAMAAEMEAPAAPPENNEGTGQPGF